MTVFKEQMVLQNKVSNVTCLCVLLKNLTDPTINIWSKNEVLQNTVPHECATKCIFVPAWFYKIRISVDPR